MSDPASPPPPTFNGKLQNYGFVKLPPKHGAQAVKPAPILAPPDRLEPRPLRKRKSPDTRTTSSPSPKRTAGLDQEPSAKALVSPSPFRSHSRGSARQTTSKAHTSLSKYASHPNHLTDSMRPGLHLLFIGVNPGLTTALTGHAYAHPTNHFWRFLHSSGITPVLHKPSDTRSLPSLYNIGNTNIVARATKDASELSKDEMNAGVAILERKISENRPEAVCLVGKSIWETVWRVRKGKAIKKEEFRYGWQDEAHNMGVVRGPDRWRGARVFVGTTTSGLAASMSKEEKERVWRELGVWVEGKRKEDEAREAQGRSGVEEVVPADD